MQNVDISQLVDKQATRLKSRVEEKYKDEVPKEPLARNLS